MSFRASWWLCTHLESLCPCRNLSGPFVFSSYLFDYMPLFLRVFSCRKCKCSATLENLTEFMSIIECPECSVTEVLNHTDLGPLDHFSSEDLPYQEEWKN